MVWAKSQLLSLMAVQGNDDWSGFSIPYLLGMGYVGRPCYARGIGCLWLLFLKPKTGDDIHNSIHNNIDHYL